MLSLCWLSTTAGMAAIFDPASLLPRWSWSSNGSSDTRASVIFYGTSKITVKTAIWIAVKVYVLAAIVRKWLEVEVSLYQIPQALSLTLFEKTSVLRALQNANSQANLPDFGNGLTLI